MRLITEVVQDLQYLEEDKKGGGKNVFIEGIFMQADQSNRNGRMYPMAVMEKEVARYQKLIDEKRSLGELGHPANPTLNLDKVSQIMLGVSSRGLGSLKLNKEGVNEVQDDFHLATVDIVADPSAHDAYVQGIYESAEWICENGVWKAIDVERAQQTLKKASKANLEETKLKMFEEFISRLSR